MHTAEGELYYTYQLLCRRDTIARCLFARRVLLFFVIRLLVIGTSTIPRAQNGPCNFILEEREREDCGGDREIGTGEELGKGGH